MGTLTVRENLMFSANLRLPQTMKHEEKSDRVDEAIEDLGLDKCADTKVGRTPTWRSETYNNVYLLLLITFAALRYLPRCAINATYSIKRILQLRFDYDTTTTKN